MVNGKGQGGGGGESGSSKGKAVQVDPVKPTLKPPGIKRLQPKCDELLQNLLQFCFQFQLAPLHKGRAEAKTAEAARRASWGKTSIVVGLCR